MSVTERSSSVAPPAEETSLSGWGRSARSRCRLVRARDAQDVAAVLEGAVPEAGVIARGAARSYGDAAQNEGGDVLDMTGMDRILWIDSEQRLVRAQAGVTIAQLMAALAPQRMTVPVVPGTRHVTLAGAIASDIHGKNHHRDGGFARHVRSISICSPAEGLAEVTPESDPDLFSATLGGMGLTGVILEATLAAEPLPEPWVLADVDRTDGLARTLELMAAGERHRYSVAWLDLLAGGRRMGRAVISEADPAPAGAAPRIRPRAPRARAGAYPASLTRPPAVEVPRRTGNVLSPAAVRAFNALRWRMSPRRERGRPVAMAPYFFPLDAIGHWNRLYGAAGLVQYQFVIPAGREEELERCFQLIARRRLPVYLAVFKRFGPASGGPLSFPLTGWTLAIDLPAAAPGLGGALQELDELVAGAGGRVYLSKDVRLRADTLAAMYPQLDRFHALRARVDPDGVLRSDLGRRVGLCGGAP